MRLLPSMQILAVAIVMWTTVFWVVVRERARLAADSSPRAHWSSRLNRSAMIVGAVGITFLMVRLVTNIASRLHTLSLLAAVACIAVGAILSGCAAWIKARTVPPPSSDGF